MHKSLNNIACETLFLKYSLHETCSYSEFFWSVFSRIRTELVVVKNHDLILLTTVNMGDSLITLSKKPFTYSYLYPR